MAKSIPQRWSKRRASILASLAIDGLMGVEAIEDWEFRGTWGKHFPGITFEELREACEFLKAFRDKLEGPDYYV